MDEQDLTYRSLSSTAVIGLVLALLSSFAFFWPNLWPLTLVALAVCWSAARSISKNADSLAGINIARMGMFLAAAIGIGTFARTATLQQLHAADADLVAEQFIELVTADNLVGANELMLPYADRQPTPEHAAIHYESDIEAIESLEALESEESVELLKQIDKQSVVLLDKNPTTPARYGRLATGRVYKIKPSEQPSEEGAAQKSADKHILVILERSSTLSSAPISWYVKEVRMQRFDR